MMAAYSPHPNQLQHPGMQQPQQHIQGHPGQAAPHAMQQLHPQQQHAQAYAQQQHQLARQYSLFYRCLDYLNWRVKVALAKLTVIR